jgi:hypothetical protein
MQLFIRNIMEVGITDRFDNEDNQHPDLIRQDCAGCGYWYFTQDLNDHGLCDDCDSVREKSCPL